MTNTKAKSSLVSDKKSSHANEQNTSNVNTTTTQNNIISSNSKLVSRAFQPIKNYDDKKSLVEDTFGTYNSIFNSLHGKQPTKAELIIRGSFGRPNKNLSFVSEKTFNHVCLLLLKNRYLQHADLENLLSTHPLYKHLFNTLQWTIFQTFDKLKEDDPNFEEQKDISTTRRKMFISAAIYYDFHIASVVRFCGGTYTGEFRDFQQIFNNIKDIVPASLFRQVKRVYKTGAPTRFMGDSSFENFKKYKQYGNHASITKKNRKNKEGKK